MASLQRQALIGLVRAAVNAVGRDRSPSTSPVRPPEGCVERIVAAVSRNGFKLSLAISAVLVFGGLAIGSQATWFESVKIGEARAGSLSAGCVSDG